MGILSLVAALGICLAAISAFLVAPSVIQSVKRVSANIFARNSMLNRLDGKGYLEQDLARKTNGDTIFLSLPAMLMAGLKTLLEGGLPRFEKISSRLLKFNFLHGYLNALVGALNIKKIRANIDTVCQTLLLFSILLILLFWLILDSLSVSIVICALIWIIIKSKASKIERDYKRKLEEQLPDVIRALAVYYGAGLTLPQALEEASKEAQDPLGKMLRDVCDRIVAGMSVNESFEIMRRQARYDKLEYLSVVLEIQQRTGGTLSSLLEKAAQSIESDAELKRSLRVHTASSRLSAKIVTVMPLVIFALMGIVNPGAIVGFLTNPIGIAMFIVACALIIIGSISIKKILGIGSGGAL